MGTGGGGTGGSGPGPYDSCGFCGPGQLLMGGRCVQVQGEPAYGCDVSSENLGGVFTACPAAPNREPSHCSGTTCAPGACLPGYADCNGNPSDGCEAWMLAPATCGSCTNACPTGQVCTSTGCAAACGPLETEMFGGSCVDTSKCDPAACPSPLHGTGTCVANACAVVCDTGYTLCSGKCVDIQNDTNHCGGCNACPSEPPDSGALACVAGVCTPRCPTGFTLCTLGNPVQGTMNVCSNLQTDLQSCGQCGMACATGLCVNGVCDSTQARVLATNVKIAHLAVDATSVYYTDDNASTIARVPKTGGTPQVLVSGESKVGGIALDGTHLYWSSTTSNTIERVPLAGGAVEMVSAASGPGALAVDGTDVFWANNSNFKVLKAPKGGGSITVLATVPSSNAIGDVQLDGIYVYWNQPAGFSMGLQRAPKDGSGSAEQVLQVTGPVMAFDQDYVYVGDDLIGQGVVRRRKDLSAPPQAASGGGVVSGMSLAVSGLFTYAAYSASDSGRALKCGGAAPVQQLAIPSQPLPYGVPIVTDAAYLYTVIGSQLQRLPL